MKLSIFKIFSNLYTNLFLLFQLYNEEHTKFLDERNKNMII